MQPPPICDYFFAIFRPLFFIALELVNTGLLLKLLVDLELIGSVFLIEIEVGPDSLLLLVKEAWLIFGVEAGTLVRDSNFTPFFRNSGHF